MRRGTTPTLVLHITDDNGTLVDLSGYTRFLTIKAESTTLDFTNDRISVNDDGELEIRLTQEETLSLESKSAKIQLRVVNSLGDAWATNIITVDVNTILKEGVIEE